MDRRALLRYAAALGLSGVAGCADRGDDDDGPTPTPTSTPSETPPPTPTETPTPEETPQPTPTEPPRGQAVSERPVDRRIGSNHVSPTYRFEDGDVLNEGAGVLEDLGLSVIACYLHEPDLHYDLSTDIEPVTSLRQAAEHPYYDELFRRGFDTYVLTAHAHLGETTQTGADTIHGADADRLAAIRDEFADLGEYLLETYDGTGAEFVLSNWELDNLLAGTGEDRAWDGSLVDDTVAWLNARQDGIVDARERVDSDAALLGACEIVDVFPAMDHGEAWAINTVVPELEVDLIGFSSHGQLDSEATEQHRDLGEVATRVHETLDYIEAHAPEPTDYLKAVMGDEVRPVIMSEFGQPEVREDYLEVMHAFRVVPPALEWGCPYLLYWTLFDNEVVIDGEVKSSVSEADLEAAFGGYPGPDDVVGWYLVDPEGEPGTRWHLLEDLLSDPGGFEPTRPYLLDAYAAFIGATDLITLSLDFDRVVSEADDNPDVPEEYARQLAIGLIEVVLYAEGDHAVYDIGAGGDRIGIGYGAYDQETTGDGYPFRWLGTDQAASSFVLIADDLEGDPTGVELTAWSVDDEIEVGVAVDGTDRGSVSVGETRDTYEIHW